MAGLAEELEQLELEEENLEFDGFYSGDRWETVLPVYSPLFFQEDKELDGDKLILPPSVLDEMSML